MINTVCILTVVRWIKSNKCYVWTSKNISKIYSKAPSLNPMIIWAVLGCENVKWWWFFLGQVCKTRQGANRFFGINIHSYEFLTICHYNHLHHNQLFLSHLLHTFLIKPKNLHPRVPSFMKIRNPKRLLDK